jgi:CRP/FNR family transcriptional regulator
VLGQAEASVGWALAEELTERLYETLEVVAGSTFGTVRQRVARHLLELAAAGQEGRALVARVSQQELADATGSVREVVARVLRELRAAGLVETGTAAIAITDPAGLHREVWSRDPRSGVSRLASSPV